MANFVCLPFDPGQVVHRGFILQRENQNSKVVACKEKKVN